MNIYNSLTRSVEEIAPLKPPHLGMYTCGMTVYDFAHIGHGRKYVLDDILRRTLVYNGYEVTHVQNVTDVGHLVSDGDDGEDKMEKGAVKAGKTVWEVAQFFIDNFYETMDSLNVLRPTVICRATEFIPEQIALIAKLIERNHAYETPEAVYFDVESFPTYGELLGQSLSDKKQAVREEVVTGSHKKNPADFALWFKRVGRFENHQMHWDSPWGDGFPGWHIECSAMSMKFLGEQFEIHTGGEDHLPIHHPNEIAQSEGATGKHPFVKYWVHYAHLMVNGTKMSKSLGNFVTLSEVVSKNIDPLALRYFYLTAHYRKHMNFTWEALDGANNAYLKLKNVVAALKDTVDGSERTQLSAEKLEKIDRLRTEFVDALNNDLNTPQVLAVVWEVVKINIPDYDKYELLLNFDEVLGLKLSESSTTGVTPMPAEITALLEKRDALRKAQKYEEADILRKEIEEKGYTVSDVQSKPTS